MRDLDPVLLGGERGDGRLLRAALALSCCTGRAFRFSRFRAERAAPGLRPSHLGLLSAAGSLRDAEVHGAEEGSTTVTFRPRAPLRPVEALEVRAGEGGHAGHLLQLLCWPLALAPGPSTLTLRGATHAAGAASFHELALAWAPAVARLGFQVALSLGAASFSGRDGEVLARVEPAHPMPTLDLRHRGLLLEARVLSLTGGHDPEAGHGLAARAVQGLRRFGVSAEPEAMALPARGAHGAQLLVLASFERVRSAHGAAAGPPGSPDPARAAVEAFGAHLASGGAVDEALAAELLLPAGLLAARLVPPAAGIVPVSRWSVGRVTPELLQGADLVARFLGVTAAVFGRAGEPGEVRVAPADASPDVLPLRAGSEA